MIIQFRDREKELAEIGEILNSKVFEFVIIYGRRRVGKTELILNATKDKKRLYYLAIGENNLEKFYNVCVNFDPEAGKLKKDWEVLFDFLKDRAEVIVIDEFQNLIKENEKILNTFQSIVDITLKGSKTKLFLLGSSVSIISSKILSYKSPLYGRRTGSINLKPVSFFNVAKFFPETSLEELMAIYGFADGIPFYLVKIDRNFWPWIKEEIKKEKTFLRDEVDFMMRYEFADSGTYKLILEAIANGKTKLNEIKDFIGLKRTDIGPYLKNLIDIGFVKRAVPVTENIKSRHGRYSISDNFLKFWFKYIYPNISPIEEGIFDAESIKKDYNSYLGFVFEGVAKQFLINLAPVTFNKIGRQWGSIPNAQKGQNTYEIDLVGLNDQIKEILFVECKWQDKVDAERVLEELKEKAKFVNWNTGKRKEYYCVIAKSFSKKIKQEDVLFFDLKDMEKMAK